MPNKINIADQQYVSSTYNLSTLVETLIPNEQQTLYVQSQDEIISTTYPMSERNHRNSYIIPVEKNSVYLNFIAEKIIISDIPLMTIIDSMFSYFVDSEVPQPDTFTLEDGIIFRCAGEGIKDIKSYTYYIMEGGKKKQIPNWKSLEVLLAERNSSYAYVRVLESSDCNALDMGSNIPDKTNEWTPAVEDQANIEKYNQLGASAKDAAALMESAKADASAQVAAVQAQADADKAAAQAAQAQAAAAQAASQAAIAEANAAAAAAAAAQAEAELAKAEFEAQTE